MNNCTNIYSEFPEQIMENRTFKNVTDEVAAYINEIKNHQSQGKYADAAESINKYSTYIKDCIIDAGVINALIEENRNAQIYSKRAKQNIYIQTNEPSFATDGDVWIR